MKSHLPASFTIKNIKPNIQASELMIPLFISCYRTLEPQIIDLMLSYYLICCLPVFVVCYIVSANILKLIRDTLGMGWILILRLIKLQEIKTLLLALPVWRAGGGGAGGMADKSAGNQSAR